ncbi:predicted protein [Neisseria gonorrhoeae 35/02]|nr:predicted protein [Neisseria gonorrhoeae 35/02]
MHAVFPLTDSGGLKARPATYGGYSGLTKIRTRRRAAGSTNGTEPIRPVLGRLREPFPLSRGGATPYRFLLIRYKTSDGICRQIPSERLRLISSRVCREVGQGLRQAR